MKKIKRIFLVLLLMVMVVFQGGCQRNEINTQGLNRVEAEENIKREEGLIGDKMPVERAMAAKMLSLYFYEEKEINSFDRIIAFEDVLEGQWYDRYVNAVLKGGYMIGKNEKNFMPEEYLNLSEAQALIDRMNKNNKIKIKLTEENKNKPISMALWNELFMKALEENKYSEIKKEELVFIAGSKENKAIKEGYVITDKGLFRCEGLKAENLIGLKVIALTRDKNILTINEVTELEPKIENALVLDKNENGIVFFVGGIKKEIKIKDKKSLEELEKGDICDFKIENNYAEEVEKVKDKISSKIRLADDEKIELEATGNIFKDKSFRVYYFDAEKVSLKDSSVLISGDSYDFFIKDGKACAVVMRENETNKIRVLINNNENKNVNGMVNISSEGDFYVITGKDKKSYKPKEEIVFEKGKNDDLFSNDTVVIRTEKEDDFININSIKTKNNECLRVRGEVEIKKCEGGYIVINEVDIEAYTEGVLNGIDTKNLKDETKKMLAVVIRSKAYKQKEDNLLISLGANVDRTDKFQAYCPIDGDESIKMACKATKGVYIKYDNNCVCLNYFGADYGASASLGEVWFDKNSMNYPFESEVYNKSKIFVKGSYGELSNENNFIKFIDEAKNDYDNPWFRWSFKMNKTEVEACINTSIKYLYKEYPSFVKCLDKSGKFISKPVETVGEVKNIEVLKRGDGGNIMEMKITGSKEIVILSTDNVIRKIIKPKQFVYGRNAIELKKFDGAVEKDLSSMPSSFYYMNISKEENGDLKEIEFKGGGNGHGVGISLSRGDFYADEGMEYKEIIKSFYYGVSIG